METEIRDLSLFVPDVPDELRMQVDQATPNRLVGYAAVFNSLSADLGGFKERIQPGAFKGTITGSSDVRALVDHNPSLILGRTSSGTLRISEDDRGLRVEIDVPDTSYGRDLLENVRTGNVKGMSFGFKVPKDGQRFSKEGGQTIRDLTNIDLREVTATSIPAYGSTSLSLRVDPSVLAEIQNPIRLKMAKRRLQTLSI